MAGGSSSIVIDLRSDSDSSDDDMEVSPSWFEPWTRPETDTDLCDSCVNHERDHPDRHAQVRPCQRWERSNCWTLQTRRYHRCKRCSSLCRPSGRGRR